MWRKLLKNRGYGVGLIACGAFLLLAVYAWGVTWQQLGGFLLALFGLLLLLMLLAALTGFVLRKLRDRNE